MTRKKIIGWTLLVVIALFAVAALLGLRWARRRFTPGTMADIHAAISSRDITNADLRIRHFLEGRYGSLDQAKNRERAFRGFFDPEHIKALELIAQHAPPDQRVANSLAMSRWLSQYRSDMTPQEKTDLGDFFRSSDGQAAVTGAGAVYMRQDVFYRANSTPVITELMTTLSAVKGS